MKDKVKESRYTFQLRNEEWGISSDYTIDILLYSCPGEHLQTET